jgi:hypothetical protein
MHLHIICNAIENFMFIEMHICFFITDGILMPLCSIPGKAMAHQATGFKRSLAIRMGQLYSHV